MSVRGNSNTATKLEIARNIKLQGAVSGSVNFDGSNNVTINTTPSNISVLTGNKTITAESTANISINYPSGFSKENCIPIACGIRVVGNQGYEFVGEYRDAMSIYWNGYTKYLNLLSDNINLHISNPQTNSVIYYYKIVLMKII